MRLWAKKNGYQLTDHHVVQRFTEDLLGEPIPVKTEEDIFRILGLEYKLPEERDI
jgi:DNA polymerase/3'-5' exonuclease PolX